MLLGAAALICACTADDSAAPQPPRVEVPVDGGDALLVGTAPVQATVPAGGTVVLANTNSGTSATHVFTSAEPGAGAPLFSRTATGAVPNAAVWGACLGGRVDPATRTCPVLPVEGPTTWDGDAYASLGSLLAGETRELRLSPALADGRELRLWCSLHPDLSVTLTVGQPSAAPAPAPDPTSVALSPVRPAEVVVAPRTRTAERLEYAPATVSVAAGGTVTWRVPGPAPHTVELGAEPELADTLAAEAAPDAPAGGWDGRGTVRSGFLSTDLGAPGGSVFRLRFLTPGRYTYACRFHPQMRGTVVVTPG